MEEEVPSTCVQVAKQDEVKKFKTTYDWACNGELCTLGAVHNFQHLCIRTERTEGEGGTRPAY